MVSRRPPSNHGPKGKSHWSRPVSGCGSARWRGEDDHGPWKVLPLLSSSPINDDYLCSWSEKSDFHSKRCITRTGSDKHQPHCDGIKQIIFVFKPSDLQITCCLLLLHVCLSTQIDYHHSLPKMSLSSSQCIVHYRSPSVVLRPFEKKINKINPTSFTCFLIWDKCPCLKEKVVYMFYSLMREFDALNCCFSANPWWIS